MQVIPLFFLASPPFMANIGHCKRGESCSHWKHTWHLLLSHWGQPSLIVLQKSWGGSGCPGAGS